MSRIAILSTLSVNGASYGSPSWDEVDLVSDATLEANWDKGTSDARRSRVHTFEPTMLALGYSGKIRVDPGDAAYRTLRDAHTNNTLIDVLILNGKIDTPGAEGYRFYAKVFNWGEDQSMGNVLYRDFDIAPAVGENDPQKAIVDSGGDVDYTDIGATDGS